jgi:hypothetical protein
MELCRKTTVAACAVGLAAAAPFAGCGKADEKQGVDEPAREGLSLPLGGVEYNVFITRELNLKIPPDDAYYKGPEPPEGQTLYGVFLQTCNKGSRPRQTADRFVVVDNQGNRFKPTALPADNAFGYHPRVLPANECIPQAGSVAQQGPTAGSMLLFKLPLANTENRPLELEIESPFDVAGGKREKLTVELDL